MIKMKKTVKKEVVVHMASQSMPDFEDIPNAHFTHTATPGTSSKSKSGKPMPTDFTKLPFALPKQVEDREKINKILRFSLRQQKEDEISDNAAIVTHLISRCFTAAGIQHRVACGYRRTHSTLCDSKDDENGMRFAVAPHAWLVVKDHIIDNTYIKNMSQKCCNFLHDHTPGCYEEAEYDITLDPHREVPSECRPRSVMRKRIAFCMRRPDFALALGHNNEHFYNFFFAMIRYMYEEHGVTVMGIDPGIRVLCWACEVFPDTGKDLHSDAISLRMSRYTTSSDVDFDCVMRGPGENPNSWRFRQCSRCMVANYCSNSCQRADWEEDHETVCLSRGSVILPPISNMPFGI